MPSPYAIDGPGVFVPARIAAGLERALNLDAYRIKVRGADGELDEVLLAWHVSAARWVDEQRGQVRFLPGGSSFDDRRKLTEVLWGTGEVAARSGCTTRAVRAAAGSEQLAGSKPDGEWRFTPEDVAQWQATRKRDRT